MKNFITILFLLIVSFEGFACEKKAEPQKKCSPEGIQFKEGQEAFVDKDYKKAFDLWLPLAEAGYVHAQDTVAYLYRNGLGVPEDVNEAIKWYRKSSEAGQIEATYNLGSLYMSGIGVEQDFLQAQLLIKKSFCNGYGIAVIGLVKLHEKGYYIPESNEEKAALKAEAEKLQDPEYVKWLGKKTRKNIYLNQTKNWTQVPCTSF